MNNRALVFKALSVLTERSKKNIYIGASLQSLLAILDLVGIALMGVIGSVGLNYVSGISMPSWMQHALVLIFGVNYKPTFALLCLSVLAAFLFTAKSFLSLMLSYRIARFLAVEQARVSKNFLEKLSVIDYIWLRKQDKQRIIYAATDGINAIFLGILTNSIIILSDSILLILIIFTLVVIDPATAIMTILLFGVIAFGLQKIIGAYLESQGEKITSSAISGREELDNFFNSFKEILVLRNQSSVLFKFYSQRVIYSNAYARNGWAQLIPKYIIEIGMILGASLIIGYQVFFSSAAESLTTLLIFISAASRLTPALLRIQSSVLFVRNSSAMAGVTFDYLDQISGLKIKSPTRPIESNSSGIHAPVELKMTDLSFAFPDESTNILNGFSLTISKGEVVAIVGPSGSGKSTLLDLALGILEPDKGKVQIDNFPVNSWLDLNPGCVAYVQQQPHIHFKSLVENITFNPNMNELDIEKYHRVLQITGLDELAKNSQSDWNSSNLSGGERQRIAIARALYLEPSLLVIDEGTSSLDAHSEKTVSDAILALKGFTTTLIVAHRLSSIKNADRILFFSKGEIADIGTFETLYSTNAKFKNLVDVFNV